MVKSALACQQQLSTLNPLERSFKASLLEAEGNGQSLVDVLSGDENLRVECFLHTLEGIINTNVSQSLRVQDESATVFEETGTPVGWQPLLADYDTLFEVPRGIPIPSQLTAYLPKHERRSLSLKALQQLKKQLSSVYVAGGKEENAVADEEEIRSDSAESVDDEVEDTDVSSGAHIPIPPQTSLEYISQALGLHPISVYWLLKQLREQEGLVSPTEMKRHLEDYVSTTVLRLLGYRWPEQDKYDKGHGPVIDPALVDDDGIIPLVSCADEPIAAERVRLRLERDFGEEGATQSEKEFRHWVGREIGEWLRRDFFKRHVQQFKQRPIAWHLVSPERTFEAFVLYHKLSRATLQKLRTQYAGNFIERLKVEQERARQRKEDARVRELQLQIEDVEEFRTRVEAIERGDELKYRC